MLITYTKKYLSSRNMDDISVRELMPATSILLMEEDNCNPTPNTCLNSDSGKKKRICDNVINKAHFKHSS